MDAYYIAVWKRLKLTCCWIDLLWQLVGDAGVVVSNQMNSEGEYRQNLAPCDDMIRFLSTQIFSMKCNVIIMNASIAHKRSDHACSNIC